jgi:hypothetical protein
MRSENMKIRVIGKKEEIFNLSKNDDVIHISFKPSTEDFMKLVQRCPKIKAIELSPLRHKYTCESSLIYIKSEGIQLFNGKLWGHCGDVNEYYEIPDSVIETIKQLKNEVRSEDEIVREVSKTSKLGEDLIQWISNQ